MNCSPTAKVYGLHTAASTLKCGANKAATLPFTGLNLLLLLGVAVALIVLGLSLRRVTRGYRGGNLPS